MARKFRLFGPDGYITKRLFGYGKDEDFFGMFPMLGDDTDRKAKLEAYKGVVYACVNLIGESFGQYKPIFYKLQGDELENIGDHEFLRLLKRPSGLEPIAEPLSQYDLFEATGSLLELQGEVYWYMAKGSLTSLPRQIIILRADKVGIDINKTTGDINGYFIRRSMGSPIPLDVDEVVHFKRFNPKNAYHGMGPVEGGEEYILIDEHTTAFTKNFFKNNGGLNGILELKGEITKDAFKAFVRKWRSQHEGVDNAGKTAIIRASEANFTKVGLGLDQIDMAALRKMSRDDVAMIFRVPVSLLGLIDEGTGFGRGNIETLEYIFNKWTINPKFEKLDATMQFVLERYWPNDKDLIVGHASIIPEDKVHELNVRDKAVDRWMTRDEIRNQDGLDPVDGGDQLRAPLATIPISEDVADTTDTENKALVIRRRVNVKVKKKELKLDSTVKEAFRLRLMRNQLSYERRFKKKVKPILKEQLKEALNNLEAHASKLTKAQQKFFDDAAYDQKFLDELTPVMVDLGEEQGALAMAFAGDEEGEFKMTAPYRKYVTERLSKMAKRFNDETQERLNASLSEGIAEGEALGKLKDRVESIYREAQGYRAVRIARTETISASNAATTEAYRQTGYVKAKEWYVNPGACPECEVFEGKTIPLDDTFLGLGESYTFTDENGEEQTKTNEYDTVEEPPLHPNCRCTIVPVAD